MYFIAKCSGRIYNDHVEFSSNLHSIGLDSMDKYSEISKMYTEAYFTSKYMDLILIFS
jgi:hypothetical protein